MKIAGIWQKREFGEKNVGSKIAKNNVTASSTYEWTKLTKLVGAE